MRKSLVLSFKFAGAFIAGYVLATVVLVVWAGRRMAEDLL